MKTVESKVVSLKTPAELEAMGCEVEVRGEYVRVLVPVSCQAEGFCFGSGKEPVPFTLVFKTNKPIQITDSEQYERISVKGFEAFKAVFQE